MSLLVVGCTAVDIIFRRVPRLPAWPEHTEFTPANLTLLDRPPLVTIGGNGANAAYVAACCGSSVTLHSNAGSDAFGELARTWLAEAGCRVAGGSCARRTAVNVTAANRRLQRATLFYKGSAEPLPPVSGAFSHVLVCGWPHPPARLLAKRLRAWRARGARTAYDAGPFLGKAPTLAGLRPVLAALDLLLANEHEALAMTGASRLGEAVARLRGAFGGDIVIKLGARGALWLPPGADRPILAAGRRLGAVNTIGAGDTFNGALLAALDGRAGFSAALRFANRAAAGVVGSKLGVLGFRPPGATAGRRALGGARARRG